MLKALPYVVAMLAIVPLAGFCVTGSWKQAWRYTRDWLRVMAILAAAAGVMALFTLPLLP